uniref:Uncharacterized protein n=1 Tax=Noctiluca scintillans TaxID=2966 RepID=A0A7S1F416_NOCSC
MHHHPQELFNLFQDHIGLTRHKFGKVLNQSFNTKQHYGWSRHVRSSDDIGATATEIEPATEEKLMDFFRPDLLDMMSLAEAGEIAPLPKAWMTKWNLTEGEVWT